MRDEDLPTRREIFLSAVIQLSIAYRALGDAADSLRSDWQPAGSSLTNGQADAKSAMFDAIGEAKAVINRARHAADQAIKDGPR